MRWGGKGRRLGGAAGLLALAVLACVPIAASGPGAFVAFAGGANPPTCGIFGTAHGSREGLGTHAGRSRLIGGALLQGAACRSEQARRRLRLREQISVGMGSGSTSVGASEEDGTSSVLEGRDGVVEEKEDDGFDEQMFLGLSEPSYVMILPPKSAITPPRHRAAWRSLSSSIFCSRSVGFRLVGRVLFFSRSPPRCNALTTLAKHTTLAHDSKKL